MRAVVIGSVGQLALELRRRRAPSRLVLLAPSEPELDLADPSALASRLDDLRPDVVLNAGAYTAVDRAEAERDRAFALNAEGPRALASWCLQHGKCLVHVSTDYVFDGSKRGAYEETDPTAPLGVYGASKLAGEDAIRGILAQHVILRTSWVFSAHGHNFVKTILRLAAERDELRVVADQRGRPTAATDLADAIFAVVEHLLQGTPRFGTFHFANAGETSWHGFAQAIVDEQASLTGKHPTVTAISSSEYPTPARRPANSVLSSTLFEQTFHLHPRPWRDALREVVRELS